MEIKTVMFCALAERWGTRTLVIAHRDELIEQAAAKVAQIWPGASVGVVKGPRDELGADRRDGRRSYGALDSAGRR